MLCVPDFFHQWHNKNVAHKNDNPASAERIIGEQLVGNGLFPPKDRPKCSPESPSNWLAGHAKYFDRLGQHETE